MLHIILNEIKPSYIGTTKEDCANSNQNTKKQIDKLYNIHCIKILIIDFSFFN